MSSWSCWDSDYEPTFARKFICLPFDKYTNPELESGNKIIMPASSLDLLSNLPVRYPLIFQIESYTSDKVSHCGVLEFCAEEGCVHMPRWMMDNLNLEEGYLVGLRDASLPKGSYMKVQPHETAFVELADPRAVLEARLSEFACLSHGDTIAVRHGGRNFYLDVLELRPGREAVSLIDTDCELDFATPLDYVEPGREVEKIDLGHKVKEGDAEEKVEVKAFTPFSGAGRRLDGTAISGRSAAVEMVKKRENDGGKEKEREEFKPFMGRGRVLGGPFFN